MRLELTDKRLELHSSFLDVLKSRNVSSSQLTAVFPELRHFLVQLQGALFTGTGMNAVPAALSAAAQATSTSAFCEKLSSLGIILSFKGFFMLLSRIKENIQVAARELGSKINRGADDVDGATEKFHLFAILSR